MYLKAFFEKIENQRLPHAGHCFVLMPFAKEFDVVYSAIKGALEGAELGFRCDRADEEFSGGFVMEDVLHKLAIAEVVIADLTKWNPNVFYELGIAHTVKNDRFVFLISQDDPPFDVRHDRYFRYTLDGLQLLQETLIKAAKKVTPTRKLIRVARGQLYESEALDDGDDDSFYRFAFHVVQVGERSVKLHLKVFREVSNDQREVAYCEPHLLRLEGWVEIPRFRIKRALKLDTILSDKAEFCVCDLHPPKT